MVSCQRAGFLGLSLVFVSAKVKSFLLTNRLSREAPTSALVEPTAHEPLLMSHCGYHCQFRNLSASVQRALRHRRSRCEYRVPLLFWPGCCFTSKTRVSCSTLVSILRYHLRTPASVNAAATTQVDQTVREPACKRSGGACACRRRRPVQTAHSYLSIRRVPE